MTGKTLLQTLKKPVSKALGIAAVVVALAGAASGCGSNDPRIYPDKGLRDSCTHNYECEDAMVCREGQCKYPDDRAEPYSAEFIDGNTAYLGREKLFACPIEGETIYNAEEDCKEL